MDYNVKDLAKLSLSALCWLAVATQLSSCGPARIPPVSTGHLSLPIKNARDLPPPITQVPAVPAPVLQAKPETYTVVVTEVSLKDLLFSLARDANLNIDVHPGLQGKVTLNALNQTLPQILERIAQQVDIRYELKAATLLVGPDIPYWQNYRVDYVSMHRKSVSEVSVATQISTTGGTVSKTAGGATEQGNSSKSKVTNTSSNDFWKTLVENVRILVGDATASSAETSSSPSVLANANSGVLNVKATQKQHHQVQQFVDQVLTNAQRQVLIEMTIVEVELGDHFQAGIDWQRLSSNAGTGRNGISIVSTLLGANLATAPVFRIGYNKTESNGSNISGTLKLLETFGNVKVISSPKLMALNNQTALLKVVDEKVYFTVTQEIQAATTISAERRIFTSEVHTVPVGLVMSVVPQISQNGSVSLNVRPTISRITGFATDPAPAYSSSPFTNLIPEIQIREMESLIQVGDGQTIVMGGLMQNKVEKTDKAIPGTSRWPKLSNLLSHRDHKFTKTELVIFLRPTVIQSGQHSSQTNYSPQFLPSAVDADFNREPPAAGRR